MKTKLLIIAIVMMVTLSSCLKKLLDDWPGTYNSTSGSSVFTRVVVSEVDFNTLKMEIKSDSAGTLVTKSTLVNVSFSNNNESYVNEEGTVSDLIGTWAFNGKCYLNQNQLTMNGTASQVGTNNTFTYSFIGNR